VFEGPVSSVQLRERSALADTPSLPFGAARERAEVAVGPEILAPGPAVSGSLAEGIESVVLPGPGGSGSGWGGGGEGSGGGGTGRGGFSVTGAGAGGAGRSYASIWNHTQRYLAGLRWAYNNELRRDPTLRGVLVVRYEILPNGAVENVTLVSSGLRHPALEQEVIRQIRTWRYPPEPAGSVIVVWPFSFVPPSG
jgi:TonB family protein